MAIYSQRMEQCAAGKRLFLEYGIAGRNHGRSFRAVPYLKARCLGADWQRALILISLDIDWKKCTRKQPEISCN